MVILWFAMLTVIGAKVLSRTKVGIDLRRRRQQGSPDGRRAATSKIGLFMAVAATGWLHEHDRARTPAAPTSPNVGQEFYYIIAAVLGGCLLTGGMTDRHVALAAVLGMAQRGITLAGWDNSLNFLFLGVSC